MNKNTKRNLRKTIIYVSLIGGIALGAYGLYKLFGPAAKEVAKTLVDIPLPTDIPAEIVLDSGSKLIFAESHNSPMQGDIFIVSQYIPA